MFVPSFYQHLDLANEIHAANVRAGWWTCLITGQPLDRDPYELLMLVYTEVAEAMEGHRRDRMDDKLKHLKMFDVELADVGIRLYDILGKMLTMDGVRPSYVEVELAPCVWYRGRTVGGDLFRLCHKIFPSDAASEATFDETHLVIRTARMISYLWGFAAAYNVDLKACMDEKRAFNETRADHKPENRLAPGGKKC